MTAYSKKHKLRYGTLRDHIIKARAADAFVNPNSKFVPVKIKKEKESSIEILVNEASVIVKKPFDASHLSDVISVLKGC